MRIPATTTTTKASPIIANKLKLLEDFSESAAPGAFVSDEVAGLELDVPVVEPPAKVLFPLSKGPVVVVEVVPGVTQRIFEITKLFGQLVTQAPL